MSVPGKSICRRLYTNCVTRTAIETNKYPWLRLDRMLRGHLSRKIFIASLSYFMLGKYSLILSTFKCCHKKGKVDETRRYNFRLFQVFFLFFSIPFFFFFIFNFNFYFFFIFSPVLLPKAKYNRKDGYWSALWQ